MSILFKKIFVSFAVLSVVVWSSGLSVLAQESIDNEQKTLETQVGPPPEPSCEDGDTEFIVDLEVMGLNCDNQASLPAYDYQDINLSTGAGNYKVYTVAHRDGLNEDPTYGQDNEEFTIRVNSSVEGPVVLDQPAGMVWNIQDAGTFAFVDGTNAVHMDTAFQCTDPNSMDRNSVKVTKLCLSKVDERVETYCGDGLVQSPNDDGQYEECDAGLDKSDSCTSQCTLIQEEDECTTKNNLLENGSFEEPEVADINLWQRMSSVLGWLIEKVSDNSATTLELHKGWSGNVAADGWQYAELDGDESTRVTQNVVTEAGAQYKLYWSFAGRHNITAEQNKLAVEVNGSQVATNGPAVGIAPLAENDWIKSDYTFTADTANTAISFKDNGLSDSFGTYLDDIRLCKIADPEPRVTIKANKIVCDSEADLPNRHQGSDITATTAQDIVNASNQKCRFESTWEFQWGKNDSLLSLAGNTIGKHTNSEWYDFSSSTDANGLAELTVNMSEVPAGNVLWFREVLKENYIPFSFPSSEYPGAPGSDVSAEFWCGQDVVNYDNAEWIDVTPDTTYYCVAINTLIDNEPSNLCGNENLDRGEQCDDGNQVSGDNCSSICEIERSQWCSALLGIYQSPMDNNAVIDLNNIPSDPLSDVGIMATWYADDNDSACYDRFEPSENIYNFNENNYLNIDWCAGLQQGVTDYIGTSSSSSQFSTIFDLNHDGKINLSDIGIVASYIYGDPSRDMPANNQTACYLHYGFPDWSVDPINYCGDGRVTGAEQCDGGEPVACTTTSGYAGTKSCNMRPVDSVSMSMESDEPLYCVYNSCLTTLFCGDGLVNGSEQCDTGTQGSATCTAQCTIIETPSPAPSGGGGGGGYSAFNIFNVQSSLKGNDSTITWQTNRQSLTWMLYGTSTSYGSEYQGANYHTGHTLELTNLLPGTLYHYQVRAKDASNNTVYDIDRTFTTPGFVPQVLGTKENACIPDVDGDIKGVMQFIAGSLIRGCGPEVYHVLGSNVFHIPNWQYLHDNYFAQRIYNVAPEVLEQYGQIMTDDTSVRGKGGKVLGTKLYPNGTLLRATDGKIYVIINGYKMHIVSLEDLKKYAGKKIINVSDQILNQY